MKEIREGIAQLLFDWLDCRVEDAADNYAVSDKILSYLHSQGVVIKVDRELPLPEFENSAVGVDRFNLQLQMRRKISEAGCVAVEPIIEESK